jgi:hypothetical protein
MFVAPGLYDLHVSAMLTAANVDAAGPRGIVRAQGLALLFAGVLRTFVDDEDEGL